MSSPNRTFNRDEKGRFSRYLQERSQRRATKRAKKAAKIYERMSAKSFASNTEISGARPRLDMTKLF